MSAPTQSPPAPNVTWSETRVAYAGPDGFTIVINGTIATAPCRASGEDMARVFRTWTWRP